jgi:hypothetical protein
MSGSGASLSFVNPRDWGNAIAGFDLAGAGPMAALLLTDPDGSLPPAVTSYLRSVRGGTSPSQGFVLGDKRSIPTASLDQIDATLSGGAAVPPGAPSGGPPAATPPGAASPATPPPGAPSSAPGPPGGAPAAPPSTPAQPGAQP